MDVAVVGGGVAGLIAAHDCARTGLCTRLFEAAPAAGGRAQTRSMDGFHFNQGPHALYTQGALNRALNALGVRISGHAVQLSDAIARWGDELHPLPFTPARIQSATPLDEQDKSELLQTFAQIAHGSYDYAGQPLTAFTARLRPRIAKLIETLTRLVTYVHAPDVLDGKAALDQMRLSFAGVHYLDGGWCELVAALVAAATSAGAEIRMRSKITRVEKLQSGWLITGPNIEPHLSAAVVLAIPPREVGKIVPQSRDLANVAQKTKAASLTCLDLGLSNLPNPGSTFALGVDQPTYFSVHSTIAQLAPEAGALIHVARYLAPDEAAQAAHLDDLERHCDLLQPGWRKVEVQRQRLVGMVVAHDIPCFQTRGQRGPLTVQDAPGLFLAGDWIGAEGMLSDASAASARAVARAVQSYCKKGPLSVVQIQSIHE